MRIILTLLAICIVDSLLAQVSVVEDSEGKSSVNFLGKSVAFNFGDSKISAGVNDWAVGGSNFFLGAQGTFSGKDGTASIFKKGEFVPEATIGTSFAYLFTKSGRYFLPYMTLNYSFSQIEIFDPDNTDQPIVTRNDNSPVINFGLNWSNQTNLLVAYGWNIETSKSNFATLDDVKVQRQELIYNSDSSVVNLITTNETEAKGPISEFDDKVGNYNQMLDILWWPEFLKSEVALGAHFRHNINDNQDGLLNAGIGFYITKAGVEKDADKNPNAFIGGIRFDSTDLTKARTDDSWLKRQVISLVVGISIGE